MEYHGKMNNLVHNVIILYSIILIFSLAPRSIECERKVYNVTCSCIVKMDCEGECPESIANDIIEGMDVQIDIRVPQLQVNTALTFLNLTSLSITGDPKFGTPNVTCSDMNHSDSGVGIIVNETNFVSLTNLKFSNCGSIVHASNHTHRSALSILFCKNVSVTSVTIENSDGYGLMIQSHQGDTLQIKSSIFKYNKLQSINTGSTVVHGGGGVNLAVISSVQGYTMQVKTNILFKNCLFENNTANNTHYTFTVKNKPCSEYGRGGGAFLVLRSGLPNVNVTFSNCQFLANHAYLGGGLAVHMYGTETEKIINTTVLILNSIFKRNYCNHTIESGGQGGGAHLTFDADYASDKYIINSEYVIKNSSFLGNCAGQGGGVFHFSGIYNPSSNNGMIIDKSTFKDNRAHIGSAIMMAPNIQNRMILSGSAIDIKLQNCCFIGNMVFPIPFAIEEVPGVGTVYISSYSIHFKKYTHFENNSGSALYVVNGIINFNESDVSFINNTALQGGAIALIGTSLMIMGPNNYRFVNNKAYYQGGAIYVSLVDKYYDVSFTSCFIRCDDNYTSFNCNATITLEGNKAIHETAGNAIYCTSLKPCQKIRYNDKKWHSTMLYSLNSSEVFTKRGFVFLGQKAQHQVSTDGFVLKNNNPSEGVRVIPGEKITHGLVVENELGNRINATFWATITSKSKQNISLDQAFSSLITNSIEIKGPPNHTANLRLSLISSRQSYIELNMRLLECPPGFVYNNTTSMCTCGSDKYVGIAKCTANPFHSYLLPGYWIGSIDSKLVTSSCPFCDYNTSGIFSRGHIKLPRTNSHSKLDWKLCGKTRTGIACGKCRSEYTVRYHSPGFLCKPTERTGCKLGWLLYILSQLVPVTIFFITVLVFNIRFTSGTINGFILFTQLISSLDLRAGGITIIPRIAWRLNIKNAVQGYRVLYGIFNLNFLNSESLSFCLWPNATALDMLAIEYVTFVYTISLIVVLIAIINQCGGRMLGKCCRITNIKASAIHGISTFLMIGYAQVVNVSLKLLFEMHIYTEKGSTFKPQKRVWLNGELEYFSAQHLPYAIPALVCLVTIGLLPPILLLMYPLLNRIITYVGLEEQRHLMYISQFLPISKLKPLFDCFQGCFKDNMRFFAGIYFLYRWSILLIHINTATYVEYYTAVTGFLLFILTLHTLCQPYIKRIHNIIDALLFCNLVLINSLSLFNFHNSKLNDPMSFISTSIVVQLLLIYLPGMILTVYLLYTITNGFYKSWWSMITNCTKGLKVVTSSQVSISSDEESVHKRLIQEAEQFESD